MLRSIKNKGKKRLFGLQPNNDIHLGLIAGVSCLGSETFLIGDPYFHPIRFKKTFSVYILNGYILKFINHWKIIVKQRWCEIFDVNN